MRISSAVVGIFGFIILIIMTGVCSVVTYGFTRQAVVDMWDSGLRIDSPGEMVSELVNPGGIQIALSPTPVGDTAIIIASATPNIPATDIPTEASPVIAESTAAVTVSGIDSQTVEATPTTGQLSLPGTPTVEALANVGQWSDPRQIRILLMGIDQRTDVEEDERFFRT